jgi:hypothetical protein
MYQSVLGNLLTDVVKVQIINHKLLNNFKDRLPLQVAAD